jgi:hypothetical protein
VKWQVVAVEVIEYSEFHNDRDQGELLCEAYMIPALFYKRRFVAKAASPAFTM